jgi:hypothetical protein
MTLATERWQEKMRYAADTGIIPPARQAGSRRLGRRLLMGFIALGAALFALGTYAGWSSRAVPHAAIQPAPKVALAAPEPAKRRSFTGQVITEATPPPAKPASPPATAHTAGEDLNLLDPETTGTISGRASEDAPGRGIAHTASAAKRPMREARLASESGAIPRSRVSSGQRRSRRSEPYLASRPGAGRVVAAAPAQPASLCLFFVACF